MLDQSIKSAGDELDEEETNVRGDSFERSEPFRAKFRAGTPLRSASAGRPDDTVATPHPAASPNRSPLASSLEVEVTGLRPLKRNAPAFFRDRAPAAGDQAAEIGAERAMLPSAVSSGQQGAALGSAKQSAVYPEATVPHFTDEEFNDWAELETSEPKPQSVRVPRHTAPQEHKPRSLPPTARRPQRESTVLPHRRGATSQEERAQGQARSRRTGKTFLGDQRDDRQSMNHRSGHDRRDEGGAIRRRPRPHDAPSEQLRPTRTSRNSAQLVDTTAERLFGEAPRATSRWTGKRHDEAPRHRPQPQRSRTHRGPLQTAR